MGELEQAVEPQESGTEEHIETDQGRDYEGEARRMGWVPKDEFRGDDNRWVDAETFVERGENELPILRERLRAQDRKMKDMQSTMKQFAEHHKNTEQKAYERALANIQKKQMEAVKDGDVEEYSRLDQERSNLQSNPPKNIDVPEDNGPPMEVQEWQAKNTWFDKDPELQAYAVHMHGYLQQTRPNMSLEQNLSEVTKEVKKRFPDKFVNPRRSQASAVEGDSQAPGGNSGKKSYRDLPAEAKAACDNFVKQGLLTREAYIKDYFGE